MSTVSPSATLVLDGRTLTPEQIEAVALFRAEIQIAPEVIARMNRARELVDEIAAGDEPVYGINTGFGALAEMKIDIADVEKLQRNLILSHAVGVGQALPYATARALTLLRANTLAVGHSGCRPLVLEHLVALLNAGCAPFVPSKGSVGASGDLAPLAHVALMLLGEGPAMTGPEHMSTAKRALVAAGLPPLVLKAKEGLALINGTQAMVASGIRSLLVAEQLCQLADIVGALSLDALQGTDKAFDARIHKVRPHPGQRDSASNLRALLKDSALLQSHTNCEKVQDPYSLRCMPQVHGATRDALGYIRSVLSREINSATDNPLVFMDGDFDVEGNAVLSGGNFHGQPIAQALDFLAIGIAEIANISERRIEQLVNPALSSGLPAFLTPNPGLNSGFMILQVTAASLINENKVLCHPASTDSIPSSANREDHVSMGMTSANKAWNVVYNVRRVLGIELLCACQAIDLRGEVKSAPALDAVFREVRKVIPFAPEDRAFIDDLEAIETICQSGVVIRRVAEAGVALA